ncbi:hypothetical protein FS749_010581 [Ceratobasidium sp. UAMH 11750]|nr:hypothetical protein FS749_010581 [Ceratobasidium sp. UAMH 11750]
MTEDTFFVNSRLLARRLSEGSSQGDPLSIRSVSQRTTLILLDEPPTEVQSLPESLDSLLVYLRENLALSATEPLHTSMSSLPKVILLPSANSSPHVQVPLAGILLDYPVAYLPPAQPASQDNHPYLSGHALDVFDICLQFSQTGDSYVKPAPAVTHQI